MYIDIMDMHIIYILKCITQLTKFPKKLEDQTCRHK